MNTRTPARGPVATAAGPRVVRVPGPARRPWWRTPGPLVVLLLALAGLGLLAAGLTGRSARSADLAADLGAGPVVAVPSVALVAPPPVDLVVPQLGLDTRLVGLSTDRAGALQVDPDASVAGWYADGPAPGDLGPAVLAGHLDSRAGPGVFAGLERLGPGAAVDVRRADGTTAHFVVREVQTYAKRAFPTAQVYAGDGTATLRVITCGGAYDPETGRYRSNTIVFADEVGEPTVDTIG